MTRIVNKYCEWKCVLFTVAFGRSACTVECRASCETEVRIRGATVAFVVSVTVQALIKVSQSIAERDESNQRSPTQSAIVEAKLRLADGYGSAAHRNRTIPRYRRYTSRAKTFLSSEGTRDPSPCSPLLRIWFILVYPSLPLRLEFKISFPFRRCTRGKTQGVLPWISSGLSRSRSERAELFSLNNTGDKRDPVCCERFRLLEKRWISLFPRVAPLLASFRFVVSSPIKVFERRIGSVISSEVSVYACM